MSEKGTDAFTKFLTALDEDDREWFEERLTIIQFSWEKKISEIEAGRIAYKCFQNHKNQNTERKAA